MRLVDHLFLQSKPPDLLERSSLLMYFHDLRVMAKIACFSWWGMFDTSSSRPDLERHALGSGLPTWFGKSSQA